MESKSGRAEALGKDPTERARNWQLLRLAALLHDVGHAPFSHATEEVMPVDGETGRPFRHERYSEEIIKNDGQLSEVINENFGDLGITPELVAAVIESPAELDSEGVLLHQIVSGELDADRMDYLARDSLYTGVSYGKYDLARLLDTVTLATWGGQSPWLLAVEAGGVHALEGFLFARYFMYIQVYLHDGRRFFDHALNCFLREYLPEGQYPGPSELDGYLQYDDQRILEAARAESSRGNTWAQAIWNREPWKTLGEAGPHLDGKQVKGWVDAQRKLESEFEEGVFFDGVEAQAYRELQLAPYALQKADEEGKYPILVVREDEDSGSPVETISAMVKSLGQDIMLMRLYARPDKLPAVKERWRECYG